MRIYIRTVWVLLLAFAIVLVAYSSTVRSSNPEMVSATPRMNTAAWWEQRHAEKLALLQRGDVDLLFVGDSITHGWEKEDGLEVWDQFYGHRNAMNIGFGSDLTEHVLWRVQNGEVAGISPKVSVVMIGTNNTAHRMDSASATASGIEAIIGQLRFRLPDSKILLLGIFPRGASDNDPMRIRNMEINQAISGFSENEYVTYLDISDAFLTDDGALSKSVMPDLLHPNAAGYRLWAEAMEPTLSALLQ